MCGISVWITNGRSPIESFRKFNDKISHRGPDSSGEYEYEVDGIEVLLGHKRLSIIDLTDSANQPFHFSTYAVVFNGEIFNYLELKRELEEEFGAHFETYSDTEVLVQAYSYWGEKCLEKFNGMFSFVILDEKKNELFAARDRYGIKPLYYHKDKNDNIFFASEIKQFLTLKSYKPIGNLNTIANFLENRYLDYSDETMFHGIMQIQGGEKAVVDLKTRSLNVIKWYDLKEARSQRAHKSSEFYKLFDDSIIFRLRSDVEVGSCLSGGLDSSSIVALADKKMANKKDYTLKAFTSSFEDKRFDERKYVELLKKNTKIKSEYLFPNDKDFIEDIEKLIYLQDEPPWSSSIYAQYRVFHEAANAKVKVMLDGQGADEIFCGYARLFYKTFFLNLSIFEKIREIIIQKDKITALKLLVKSILRKSDKSNSRKIISVKFNNMFKGEFASLKEHTCHFVKYHLPALLHYEDRNSMGHSIEARLPFMDYNIVEFGYLLPDKIKISGGIGKSIIREAMKGLVPDGILNRKDKMGFVTPQKIWMNKNKAVIAHEIESLKDFNFIDNELLKKCILGLESAIYDEGLLMRLYTFSVWLRVFGIKGVS